LPGRAYIHSTDDLNTTNVYVPVVVYLSRHDGKFHDDKEIKRFVHWLYAASMWARYSSQTDQKLDHDISIVQRNSSPWQELIDAIIEQRGRIEVKPSDLEGRGIQHPLYRMMFIITKTRSAVDWFNGIPLSSAHTVDNRYVFPTAMLYQAGNYNPENHLHKKLVTEIANRFFITNGSSAAAEDIAPSKFLAQVDQKFSGALTKQFIPSDPHLWSVEHFEEFLVARRKLIVDAINSYMEQLITESEIIVHTLEDLLLSGESASLEYKSSLRWDIKLQAMNPDILQKVIFKTIAGFLNVEGGTLLIGVADDGTVLGVEHDLKPKPQTMDRADRDAFGLLFQNALLRYLAIEFNPYIHLSFKEHNAHTVAIVEVDRSPKPVYLKDKGSIEFYIRAGVTTRMLDMAEAHNHISMHWEL
jgi:hypothetical protein